MRLPTRTAAWPTRGEGTLPLVCSSSQRAAKTPPAIGRTCKHHRSLNAAEPVLPPHTIRRSSPSDTMVCPARGCGEAGARPSDRAISTPSIEAYTPASGLPSPHNSAGSGNTTSHSARHLPLALTVRRAAHTSLKQPVVLEPPKMIRCGLDGRHAAACPQRALGHTSMPAIGAAAASCGLSAPSRASMLPSTPTVPSVPALPTLRAPVTRCQGHSAVSAHSSSSDRPAAARSHTSQSGSSRAHMSARKPCVAPCEPPKSTTACLSLPPHALLALTRVSVPLQRGAGRLYGTGSGARPASGSRTSTTRISLKKVWLSPCPPKMTTKRELGMAHARCR
mmetsp:Transcript_4845/g.14903  ORF Transcript_4845/g.14903 Transcript_4845/m.14903 type:complete len:336 (-) Transcript_4845:624-1631(-)